MESYREVFFLYGSTLKAVAYHMPFEKWKEICEDVWNWSLSKIEALEERKAIQGENREPQAETPKAPSGKVITQKQRQRFWGMAKSADFTDDGIKALLKQFGYTRTQDISMEQYEGMCAKLTKANDSAYNAAK